MSLTLKRMMWAAGLLLAAFAAYMLLRPAPSGSQCPGPVRHINVEVGVACPTTVEKALMFLDVRMGKEENRDMMWQLKANHGSQWKFAESNAIEVINDPGASVFFDRKLENDKVYRMCNANKVAATYTYHIHLVGPRGATCTIDPLIHNQN